MSNIHTISSQFWASWLGCRLFDVFVWCYCSDCDQSVMVTYVADADVAENAIVTQALKHEHFVIAASYGMTVFQTIVSLALQNFHHFHFLFCSLEQWTPYIRDSLKIKEEYYLNFCLLTMTYISLSEDTHVPPPLARSWKIKLRLLPDITISR